ncbi:hypothetical protein [Celerinatantimonas sp. YJH-8]|uniref:hypothetical protein n=1 Tax=Celerinatantimonas sp. YJH-8 TaxID=3228714 RepID=UPI0038CA8445
MAIKRSVKAAVIASFISPFIVGGSMIRLAVASEPAAESMASTQVIRAELDRMAKVQQQYEEELSKMRQLRQEYETKLAQLSAQQPSVKPAPSETITPSQYQSLKDKLESITLFGFFRAKYDHDDPDGIGAGSNNRHFYMDLEGKMKVSENWEAHFQSETRKGYTIHQSWRSGDEGSDDQDGTFQRIWVEGRPENIGIALGTKWWGLGFQNVPFGHAADGIQVDYDLRPQWNGKVFWLRPRQGALVTMPNGSKTNIRGVNLTGNIMDKLATSVTYATNDNHHDEQKMSHLAAIEFQAHPIKDIVLNATYVRTNADHYNTSQEYRIDYKEANLNQVGSYGLYTRYIDFERYGDYSHDDEWASMLSDTRGWIWGLKFVPFKHVVWETFYSVQRRNRASNTEHLAMRHLFRSQVDFHF